MFWVVLLSMLLPAAAWAEQVLQLGEVVVTASRMVEPKKETTSSVVVITGEDIKKSGAVYLPDVLRRVTELNVVQNGGVGKKAAVYLRGASPDQTLVMIDGVKVKSTTSGGFDFSGISVDDIERIEIVKGPQSTMYGSEAMGGVINIITKKGRGELKADVSYEFGAYNTSNPAITVSGGSEAFNYRLSASHFKTDGISAVKSGTEKDGYENRSFSGKLGTRLLDVDLEFSGMYYEDQSDLDGYDYISDSMVDDPNYVQTREHYMLSGKGAFYASDVWEQILTISTTNESIGAKDPDTQDNNWDVVSDINTIDWRHNYYKSKADTLTAGAEHRTESGQYSGWFDNYDGTYTYRAYDKSVENKAVYLNNKLKRDNLTFNAGLRHDEHQIFGSATTYRVGAVEDMRQANMRVRASYGTGFRAPNLNDLYYPGSGNIELKPEKSVSWEIGADQDYSKNLSLFVIYFEQDYEDLISGWPPKNVDKAEVKGVETGFTYRLTESLKLDAAYTYLDTEDKSTGERLKRRPEDKVNASLSYSGAKLSLLADYIYVGDRFDGGDLDPYELVNLSGSFKVTKSIGLFGRVENLLDEDYEETRGYGTPGKSYYGGVKATF